MIKFFWLVAAVMNIYCLINGASARSATAASHQHVNGIIITAPHPKGNSDSTAQAEAVTATSSSALWKDISLVYKMYQQCSSENLSVCLKVKLLTHLEKLLRSAKTLKIVEGVQFVNTNGDVADSVAGATQSRFSLSEKDIEAVLPRGAEARDHVLNNMIFKKLSTFLQSHTLQLKFPNISFADNLNTNSVESRGKKKDKKGGGAYIMIPLLLGGTFVPIAYGALAMLAGKALIVSKLALVLASIIGIKKLLSSSSKDSHEVVVSSGGHSGWGRDFDLAYNGWKPAKETMQTM